MAVFAGRVGIFTMYKFGGIKQKISLSKVGTMKIRPHILNDGGQFTLIMNENGLYVIKCTCYPSTRNV